MLHASMIAFPTLNVPRKSARVALVLETLRDEAALEIGAAFAGVSGKRIDHAGLPGFGRHGVSRALNGCESNPLFRLVGWFFLARRLGIPKSRLQRVIDWLQTALDSVYDDEPAPALEAVLDHDAALDGRDELPRQRAARGDRRALVELLEVEQEQLAHGRIVVLSLRAAIGQAG